MKGSTLSSSYPLMAQINKPIMLNDRSKMRILFLAPEPFFQERGTPIAVKCALEALGKKVSVEQIDLLTYHEGTELLLPRVNHIRIKIPGFLSSYLTKVRPGISLKKIACDFFFFIAAIKLAKRAHQVGQPYQVVHAVEESAFAALIIKKIWGYPYVYDMDSTLTSQLIDRWPLARIFKPIFGAIEAYAIKEADVALPMCDALKVLAQESGAERIEVLKDFSLIDNNHGGVVDNLRELTGAKRDEILILYVGNLEPYQGVNLLIKAFSLAQEKFAASRLIIIGGTVDSVAALKVEVANTYSWELVAKISILGSRPLSCLGDYLIQAEILASPRTLGNNTPMKVYSYLHAARAIIATDIDSHRQALDPVVAKLVKPNAESFASGLVELMEDPDLRDRLARAAKLRAEEQHTSEAFLRTLNRVYDSLSLAPLGVDDGSHG